MIDLQPVWDWFQVLHATTGIKLTIFYDAFDRARSPDDLEPVTATIREGLDEATLARALLEGLEPPEPRPPCFFDPRHGPSTRKVEWPTRQAALSAAGVRSSVAR